MSPPRLPQFDTSTMTLKSQHSKKHSLLLVLLLSPTALSWQGGRAINLSRLISKTVLQPLIPWRRLPISFQSQSFLGEQIKGRGNGEDAGAKDEQEQPASQRIGLRHTVSNLWSTLRSQNEKNGEEATIVLAPTTTSNGSEQIVDELELENQLLRQTIRQLELENDRLSSQQRVVLENFEGEGRLARKQQLGDIFNGYYPANGELVEEDMMNFGITLTGDELTGDVATTAGMTDEEAALWCDALETGDDSCPLEPTISFGAALRDRAYWLVGLLVMQSCSGLILSRNEALLANHPIIIYFLTMLVGAGGNAGNQASVRVIRGLALGTLNEKTRSQFLNREFKMAASLSTILSIAGFLRAAAFRTPLPETIAVTASLALIVFSSVCLGAVLPLLLQKLGVDPAHSSTTIQVVMDILGVFFAVAISSIILDTPFGMMLISKLGG